MPENEAQMSLEQLAKRIEQLTSVVEAQQSEIRNLRAERSNNHTETSPKKTSRRALLRGMGFAAAGLAAASVAGAVSAPAAEANIGSNVAIDMGEANIPTPVGGVHPVTALRNYASGGGNGTGVAAPTLFHVEQTSAGANIANANLPFSPTDPTTGSGLTDIQNITIGSGSGATKPFTNYQISLATANNLPAGSGSTAKTNVGLFAATANNNGTAIFAVGTAGVTSSFGAAPASGNGDVVTIVNASSLFNTNITAPTSAGININSDVALRFSSISKNVGAPPTSGFAVGSLYVDSEGSLFYLINKTSGTTSTPTWVRLAGTNSNGAVTFLPQPFRARFVNPSTATATDLLTGDGTIKTIPITGKLTVTSGASATTDSPIPATATAILASLTNVRSANSAPGNLNLFPANVTTAPATTLLNITGLGPNSGGFVPNLTTSIAVGLAPTGTASGAPLGVNITYNSGSAANTMGYALDIVAYFS